MVFEFRTVGLALKLRILEIGDVLIHEEIVPELLEQLIADIKQNNAVKDPVIVDKRSLVVLDGMHRVAALERLGCTRLPVCEVDYRHPAIKVGCWYRVVKGIGEEKFVEIVRLLGLKVLSSSPAEAKEALERREIIAAYRTVSGCLMVQGGRKGDVLEAYTWVKRLELALREEGAEIRYEHEEDAERRVGETGVLMVPCVKKEEVLQLALAGHVFAHKTTRHMVPARPVNIGVPLEWLYDTIPLDEVNRMFEEWLSNRRVERLPPGSVWEGRRYEEEILVFR